MNKKFTLSFSDIADVCTVISFAYLVLKELLSVIM